MFTEAQADKLLPSKPTQREIDPKKLIYLLIAEPKWGKTKFFMSVPGALLLAYEAGHSFQRGFKLVIDKWDVKRGRHDIYEDDEGCKHVTMEQAVELLEASDKFPFVIFDTVDMAVKMCVDFFVDSTGVEHPSDLAFGKGYDKMQNTPFRRAVLRILKTGRGIGFITHTKVALEKFTTGEKARKETTLPNGIMRFVYSQADIILHGEFGKKQPNRRLRDRILVTEGEMDTMAGNRTNALLPARYIVSPENSWKQFASFFRDPDASTRAEKEYRTGLKNK